MSDFVCNYGDGGPYLYNILVSISNDSRNFNDTPDNTYRLVDIPCPFNLLVVLDTITQHGPCE